MATKNKEISTLFFSQYPDIFWRIVSIYYPFSEKELFLYRDYVYWGSHFYGEEEVGISNGIDPGINCNNNLHDEELIHRCFKYSVHFEIIPDCFSGGHFTAEQMIDYEIQNRIFEIEAHNKLIDDGRYYLVPNKEREKIANDVHKYFKQKKIDTKLDFFELITILSKKRGDYDLLLFNPNIWDGYFGKIIDSEYLYNFHHRPSWLLKANGL